MILCVSKHEIMMGEWPAGSEYTDYLSYSKDTSGLRDSLHCRCDTTDAATRMLTSRIDDTSFRQLLFEQRDSFLSKTVLWTMISFKWPLAAASCCNAYAFSLFEWISQLGKLWRLTKVMSEKDECIIS